MDSYGTGPCYSSFFSFLQQHCRNGQQQNWLMSKSSYHGMRTQTSHLLVCQNPWTNPEEDLQPARKVLTMIPATRNNHHHKHASAQYNPITTKVHNLNIREARIPE